MLTLNGNAQNFVTKVVNDTDNGSQLISVTTNLPTTPRALEVTGILGMPLNITAAGGVNAQLGGAAPKPATIAVADCSLTLTLPAPWAPVTPPGLPTIKVIVGGMPIPQTVSGLTSQLQTALSNSLMVNIPGASG